MFYAIVQFQFLLAAMSDRKDQIETSRVQSMWSARILLKYTLLQLPGIAVLVLGLLLVRQWIELPSWLMWSIIGLWIAKEIIFYPFVWRAYDWGREGGNNTLIGLQGIAKDRLDPSGYIFVRGELWKARANREERAIEKGDHVVVKGINGLTLLVELDKNKKTA